MRRNLAAAMRLCALSLLAGMSACGNLAPEQQAKLQQALSVACNVDGVMVPVAQPIVATIGPGGATAANLDSLLVHPAVVAACRAVNGTPAAATPTGPAVAVPDTASDTPAG